MADIVDPKTRSRMMSGIRGKNTKPELTVRRFLHSQGFRYRLHRKRLPGRPDIVLPKYGTVVLVHGCFWHQHAGCRYAYMPKSNRGFWEAKLGSNVERDKQTVVQLRRLGWRVKVLWECEVAEPEKLRRLVKWIRSSPTYSSSEVAE